MDNKYIFSRLSHARRGICFGIGAVFVFGCDYTPREVSEGAGPPVLSSARPALSALPARAVASALPPAASTPGLQVGELPPAEPTLRLSPGAEAAGVSLNQLRVVPADSSAKDDSFHQVSAYAIFRAPFSRRLELRAQDADDVEVGRSEREDPLSQEGDSAGYVSFSFDPRMPIEDVAVFMAHVDPAPEPEPTPRKRVAKRKPPPKPQPQFIRPPGPDPIPKNP